MRINTSGLTGAALDWAVAYASGRLGQYIRDETRPGASILDMEFDEFGELVVYVPGRAGDPYVPWRPSSDWSQGGPIIERERIELRDRAPVFGDFEATIKLGSMNAFGPTPLIAAMRCYVASKLGDTVDVPDELLS
jgi:hypothetical protein